MTENQFLVCVLVFIVLAFLVAIYDTHNLLKERKKAIDLQNEFTAESKCQCDTPCNAHCDNHESKFN